jgi:hypothetical protein
MTGQPAGQQRRHQRAAVDAHVEQGEAAIATRVVTAVELPDHGGDVRLEQPVADDHHRQPDQEHLAAGQHHHKQAHRHHQRAEQDRALVADDLVRHVTAKDAGGVDQRRVRTEDAAGPGLAGGIAVVEVRHDVQRQRPAHAVEREALPELGHEQHPQRARMAEQLRIGGCVADDVVGLVHAAPADVVAGGSASARW